MAVNVTNDNAKEFMATELPIVLDFSAAWCGPCKQLAPIIDELSQEYEGRIAVGKCDIEEADDLTAEYGIRNVPTVIFIKDGDRKETEIFKMFNEACAAVQSQVGFDEELVCFVNPAVWSAMQTSDEIARYITVSDFKKGELNTKVKSINGIALLPVADNRMKSAYRFNDGVSQDETAGGFVA